MTFSTTNPRLGDVPAGTELLAPSIELYVEGVQIPFVSITVEEVMGKLPTLNAEIPYHPLFLQIDHAYQPKVHLFTDGNLTFNGFIAAINSSKTTSSASMSISCLHAFTRLKEVTINFSGEMNTSNFKDSVAKMSIAPNTSYAMEMCFKGLVPGGTYLDEPMYVSSEYQPNVQPGGSWVGVPGILVNFWNQLKISAIDLNTTAAEKKTMSKSTAMTDLYIPLIDGGLQFFASMTGHPYLETQAPTVTICKNKYVLPPTRQGMVAEGARDFFAMLVMQQKFQFSDEFVSLWDMYETLTSTIDYSIQVLATPGLNSNNTLTATVVHPITPLYYSPACNVIHPNELVQMSFSSDNYGSYTRIVSPANILGTLENTSSIPTFTLRAPESVRSAVASANTGGNFSSTYESGLDAVGAYEYGQGIRPLFSPVPPWMSYAYLSGINATVTTPDAGGASLNVAFSNYMANAWTLNHPNAPGKLNPWAFSINGVQDTTSGFLFASLAGYASYVYGLQVMGTRVSSVVCTYNPYLLVGYPIDVMDSSPYGVSIHGLLTAATHQITPDSVTTMLSISNVQEYTELGQYQVAPLQPWMAYTMKLAGRPTLVNNPCAKEAADKFYQGPFGIGAVDPGDLYDFTNQCPKDTGNVTYLQAVNTTRRPTVSMAQYPQLNNQDITFIPISVQTSGTKNVYLPVMKSTPNGRLLEVGESRFLDYTDTNTIKGFPYTK